MSEKGIVNIRGKNYKTVAYRVNEFRNSDVTGLAIETEIIVNTVELVVMKAWITDEGERVIATGYAEEIKGSTNINKTSALENCETSAIGRALACFGLGGEEYASANEVSDVIIDQEVTAATERLHLHMGSVREHFNHISDIKMSLENGHSEDSMAAWFEIPVGDRRILLLAPSKGGIFTTAERAELCSDKYTNEYKKRIKEGKEPAQTEESINNV